MKRHALIVVAVLASVVPFASRAVFLDEHIFIEIARSAQTRWLFPQDMPGTFFGAAISDFASHTHPPVGEYYLALIYALLGGFSEVPFRLLFAVFPIAAALAFYSLARRFVSEPLWVTLLFTFSPAFVMYAPTLMMDVPMLAFLLTGFALYFNKVRRRWTLPAASLCFILAVGTGYTALVPLGCFFVGLLAARRPRYELLAVAAAPAALAVWLVAMTVHFDRFPLIGTARYFMSQGSVVWNVVAAFTFVGGVTVFPLAATRWNNSAVAFLILAVAAIVWPVTAGWIWVLILIASGAAMLGSFATCARRLIASGRNSGEAFLLLWVPAVLGFFIVAGDMINGRYILLAAPALFLVVFRDTPRRQLIGILIPTALLAMIVAYADFAFVNANRAFVEQEIAPLQKDSKIWGGAEAGLRFYLERRGILTLRIADTRPDPGDLIVRHAALPLRYGLSPNLENRLAVRQTFTLGSDFPIRTFNAPSQAGFHDSRVGLAPFVFSRSPFDQVEIVAVNGSSIE